MSTTTNVFGAAPTRDQIVAGASNLNQLVKTAETYDPDLAARLTTKAAIYSKTNWFVPLSMVLSWAASHFGFALDADTTSMVIVVVGSVVTWIMRFSSKGAVSGVVAAPVATTGATT